jgi:hypothetical protein
VVVSLNRSISFYGLGCCYVSSLFAYWFPCLPAHVRAPGLNGSDIFITTDTLTRPHFLNTHMRAANSVMIINSAILDAVRSSHNSHVVAIPSMCHSL